MRDCSDQADVMYIVYSLHPVIAGKWRFSLIGECRVTVMMFGILYILAKGNKAIFMQLVDIHNVQ
jgi:hypothetical protein